MIDSYHSRILPSLKLLFLAYFLCHVCYIFKALNVKNKLKNFELNKLLILDKVSKFQTKRTPELNGDKLAKK